MRFNIRSRATPELAERYRKAARSLERVLDRVEPSIVAGVTTATLDSEVRRAIGSSGLRSSFVGNGGYPSYITASVNAEVINTLPTTRLLCDGDMLKLQLGVIDGETTALQGWTYAIGDLQAADRRLCSAAQIALGCGVDRAIAGNCVRDITTAIFDVLTSKGYEPNRNYVGHAMGENYREPPRVPAFIAPIRDLSYVLREEMVLTIVVIAHDGRADCFVDSDGWNVVATDGQNSAHYSQMIVVGRERSEVLTQFRR